MLSSTGVAPTSSSPLPFSHSTEKPKIWCTRLLSLLLLNETLLVTNDVTIPCFPSRILRLLSPSVRLVKLLIAGLLVQYGGAGCLTCPPSLSHAGVIYAAAAKYLQWRTRVPGARLSPPEDTGCNASSLTGLVDWQGRGKEIYCIPSRINKLARNKQQIKNIAAIRIAIKYVGRWSCIFGLGVKSSAPTPANLFLVRVLLINNFVTHHFFRFAVSTVRAIDVCRGRLAVASTLSICAVILV
ncbi:hypothetical protein J6590_074552 [Homalodisca vitripennis]|nr:hypothetical protein J6590_074552 [Homalodisca vitripennis]